MFSMNMFKNTSLTYVVFAIGLVAVASFFGNSFRDKIIDSESKDDYELVKKYLLNDSTMYGKNRPKLWIHSSYEVNARKWKNFMSRTSTDLNQPYLYLTIQSIINHCGDDFHICLIDDDSFEKLIPSWTMDLTQVPEPMKKRFREMAMVQLLYVYGGMIVPNSFLCTKPLIEIYKEGISKKVPFIAEKIFYSGKQSNLFMPDIHFMGSSKEDKHLKELILYLNTQVSGHFQNETVFEGRVEKWCMSEVSQQRMDLIDGQVIGIKTKIGKPILIEDLMSNHFLATDSSTMHGINIPKEELLRRPKFQYYAILPVEQVLEADNILSKYFKLSMVDGVDEYYKKRSIQTSIVAI